MEEGRGEEFVEDRSGLLSSCEQHFAVESVVAELVVFECEMFEWMMSGLVELGLAVPAIWHAARYYALQDGS